MELRWFKEIPKLETAHYYLRGITEEDVPVLFEFMSDVDTMKFITPRPVKTVEELKVFVISSIENFRMKKELPWVIIHKENEEMVGMFRFHKLHLWHRKTEMGVVIRKEYQQKGVMTEILNTILPFGFNELQLNRIVGDIFAGNKGSEKLLTRFGFHKDGVLRQTDFDGVQFHDTVVYSLLKDEFQVNYPDIETLKHAIEHGWSAHTSSKWSLDNKACGQCGVTALVVHDYMGGEIAKTRVEGEWHFYNVIKGKRHDFTVSQFLTPPLYEDVTSSREEAYLDTNESQYTQLKKVVKDYIDSQK